MTGTQRQQAPHTRFAQPPEEQISESCAALAIARAERRNAMGEVNSKTRIRGKRENMFIPRSLGGSRNRNLVWLRSSSGQQPADPSQRFDGFVVRVGAGNHLRPRCSVTRLRPDDAAIKP